MNSIFKEVFSVTIRHTYYRDGYCNDFDFMPTHECLKSMSRFGLLFRKNNYGISVLTPVSLNADGKPKTPNEPLISFDEVIKLDFAMILKNHQFLNITSIDELANVNYKNTLCYYSNAIGNAELSLLSILNRPSNFTYKVDSNTRSIVNFELSDENDNVILQKEITESDVGMGNFSCEINLSGYSSGIYTISVDDENIEESFYINDKLYSKPVFGIISISSTPGNLFDPANPVEYEINFQAVKKQWKFFVFSKTTFDNLKIIDSADNPQCHFIEETPAPLENARYFKSIIGPVNVNNNDKELPFSESSFAGIQLIDGNRVLIENISVPNINNPKAEIYIYV